MGIFSRVVEKTDMRSNGKQTLICVIQQCSVVLFTIGIDSIMIEARKMSIVDHVKVIRTYCLPKDKNVDGIEKLFHFCRSET